MIAKLFLIMLVSAAVFLLFSSMRRRQGTRKRSREPQSHSKPQSHGRAKRILTFALPFLFPYIRRAIFLLLRLLIFRR